MELTEESIKNILIEIRKSKKYRFISEDLLLDEIKKYFESNKKIKSYPQTIKEIKARLHEIYSSFQTKKKAKKEQYLGELKAILQNFDKQKYKEINEKLLSMTISTKERIKDYDENLYKELFKITGEPKTVVDFGAGFNPLSYPYMNLSSLNLYAYDIEESDVDFLNEYFNVMKQKGLNGKAEILSVLKIIKNPELINKIPGSDIIFMFKLIDIIDQENHKNSEDLIKLLITKTKFIIASFATRTITQRKMNFPNRKWFEIMLSRISLKFKTLITENEIFYIISK
jgi:hypothetical protein